MDDMLDKHDPPPLNDRKVSRSLYRPIFRQTIGQVRLVTYLAFLVLRVFVPFFVPPLVAFR